jgi:hypothetical protein
VTNELDTLATALYVKTDDLLKQAPYLAPWRPRVGITPKLADAELVTLAVLQALLGYTSESRWLRFARAPWTGVNVWLRAAFAVALACIATRAGESAWAGRRHSAHAVLTGLLDQSALYGVLAEIEALGLDLLEIRRLAPQRRSPGSGDRRSP